MKAMSALVGMSCGKAGVQRRVRCDDAETVGADDPHSIEIRSLGRNSMFQLLTVRPRFTKARRQNQHARDSRLATVANDIGTVAAGVQTTAKSAGSGNSVTLE